MINLSRVWAAKYPTRELIIPGPATKEFRDKAQWLSWLLTVTGEWRRFLAELGHATREGNSLTLSAWFDSRNPYQTTNARDKGPHKRQPWQKMP